MFFRAKNKNRKITGPWNIGHCDLNLFWGQRPYYIDLFPKVWHSAIKYYLRYKAKSLNLKKKNRLLWPTFLGQRSHHYHWLSNSMVIIHQTLFKIWAKSLDHEKIDCCDLHCFTSKATLCWLIITKYNVQTSNNLQNIRQNHWTMKYRSQWPINIFRSNVRSYWLIVPKYNNQLLNSF